MNLVLLPRLGASVRGALRGKQTVKGRGGRRTVEGRENADGTVTISHAAFDLLRLKDHAFDNVKEVSCGCSVRYCLPGSFCLRLDSCTVCVLLAVVVCLNVSPDPSATGLPLRAVPACIASAYCWRVWVPLLQPSAI